jgi:hypothetical protein
LFIALSCIEPAIEGEDSSDPEGADVVDEGVDDETVEEKDDERGGGSGEREFFATGLLPVDPLS